MSLEDKNMKCKIDEAPTFDVAEPKSSQFLKLVSSPVAGESSSWKFSKKAFDPSNDRDRKDNLSLKYVCNYCERKFSSSHALGGHQNAHKHEHERQLKKERKKFLQSLQSSGARYPTHPYPGVVNNYQHSPSHYYYAPRSQHPMAQIPSMTLPHHSPLGYGHYHGVHVSNASLHGHQYRNISSSSGHDAIPPNYNLQGLRVYQNQAHAGVGNPLENPRDSCDAPQAREEMDLTLKL